MNNSSTLKLTNFPEEILLQIMDHLPPYDLLLSFPLVCTKITKLKWSACCRRRSLTLMFGDEHLISKPFYSAYIHSSSFSSSSNNQNNQSLIQKPKFLSLQLSNSPHKLTWKVINTIIGNFPNVRHLQLSFDRIALISIVAVTNFLKHYQTNLKSLHFNCEFNKILPFESVIKKCYAQILNQINSFGTQLKSLTFCAWDFVIEEGSQIDLPILSQLESFYFYSLDHASTLYKSLVDYGEQNDRLRRIGIHNQIHTKDEMVKLFLGNRENQLKIASKFTHVSFADSPVDSLDSITNFSTHTVKLLNYFYNFPCGALYSLSLNLKNLSLAAILTALYPIAEDPVLSNLKYLELNLPNEPNYYEQICGHLEGVEFELRSIKYLYLQLSPRSHKELELLELDKIFTNLSEILVKSYSRDCTICHYSQVIGNNSDCEIIKGKCGEMLISCFSCTKTLI